MRIGNRLRQAEMRGEQGQSLLLIIAALTAVFAMAAMSIDVASWYVTRHSAQVSADAAALAAANCLANAGSGKTCTSATDTTDAAQVATTFANDNHVPISTINFANSSVTVTTATTPAKTFAGIVNVPTPTQHASAVADFTKSGEATDTTCTPGEQSSGECDLIFAGGTCSAGDGATIGGGLISALDSVDGPIVSDGKVDFTFGLGILDYASGPIYYGPTSDGCDSSDYTAPDCFLGILGLCLTGSSGELSSNLIYPADFRAGGNMTEPACTYTAGGSMPSGVTSDGTNITIFGFFSQIPPGVYCAPSGTINVDAGLSAGDVTLIANAVNLNDALSSFSPCTDTSAGCPSTNKLLIYQTGTSTLNLNAGLAVTSGIIFAPNASIQATSNFAASTVFLEGLSVDINIGILSGFSSIEGDGPPEPSMQGSTSGSDALAQ